MNVLRLLIFIFVVIMLAQVFGVGIEGWGTSPATMIQLASSSGYYPFWRYGYGYRYPYYRYIYPYQGCDGTYQGKAARGHWPSPHGTYKYY